MSDRDNRYKEEPMMAGCSSNLCDQDDDTGEANNNQINCAPSSLLRRSHRIGPLRTMKNNASEEQLSTRSPIRIQFRPNPGRSFDGFLDRFTKRGGGGGPKKVKPSLLHKRDLKNIFMPIRGSCRVSPTPSLVSQPHNEKQQLHRESIVLHDPLTDEGFDIATGAGGETASVGGSSKSKKSNLLHTIKIYLHGKSSSQSPSNKSSPLLVSINDTTTDGSSAIDRGNSILQESATEKNNKSIGTDYCDNNNSEPERQNQTHYQFDSLSDRSKSVILFRPVAACPSTSSTSTILRNSVNTSLTILSASGGGSSVVVDLPATVEEPLENRPQSKEAVDETSKREKTKSMNSNWRKSNTAEEEEISATAIADLDSEFREVLQFNIGQSVRPPLVPRALLRHVTSIESDNGEEEAEEEKNNGDQENELLLSEQQPRGGFNHHDEDHQQENQCVSTSSDNGNYQQATKRSMRRLIPFHNSQDNGGGGETATSATRASASTQDLNEFQSLLNSYPGGGGVATTAVEEGRASGSSAGMPAHGDLIIDEASNVESTAMSSGQGKKEHLYKILVIGELGTGKTSFIKRYVHQFFSNNYRATIGVDFALKVIPWDEATLIRLQLWDIAGQERFGNMTRVYYKEAVGAFIVFDVTRQATFDAVKKWKQDLDGKVQLPDGTTIPCMLLANKCDQEKQGFCADSNKMDEFVKENDFIGWYETSAKDNINIDESARALVAQILLNDRKILSDEVDGEKITLEPQAVPQASKKCSC